jgi:hypothetical protein
MSSRLLTCLFAATALLTVGCDDSSGIDDDEAANVRIVNASPVVGELDVLVNDDVDTDAGTVGFLNSSGCVRVNADDPELSFQQTGGTVAIPAQTFAFDEGGRNTVVIAGTSGNLRVVTLSDALTPDLDDDEARIRVVNGRATTNMAVTVTPWNQTPGSAQTINTGTSPATNWIVVPANQTVAIRLTTTGANPTFIDALNIVPTEGQELIVVAADPATGTTTPLQWVVTRACSRP